MKKILFALLFIFITMAFSQSTPFEYGGWYNGAFYVPNATYTGDIVVVDEGDLAGESLNETDFATHANWDVTNDFDDSGGNAAFIWSANQTSTLTQTSGGNLAIDGVADKWYKFEYTVAVTTAFDGDGAATITNAFALAAVSLDLSAGSHIVYFMSAAAPGDFVISVVSGTDTEGTWTIDDVTLKEITGGDVTVYGNILGYGTLGLGSGTTVNEFSTDTGLAGDSDDAVPTEKAVKAYADAIGGAVIPTGSNNEILTDDGAGAIISESQLLFDGLNLTVGVSVDDVQPSFKVVGDADSDAGGDVSETIILTLTPNADPLLAYWGFTSTQSAGYKFDKAIDVTGNIIVSGTVDGIDIATDVAANTTHRGSDGTDHTFINQDLRTSFSPAFVGLSLTGEFDLTGANALIDMNPANTNGHVIDITPTAAIVAGGEYDFIHLDGGNLDPLTGVASYIHGFHVDFSGILSADGDDAVTSAGYALLPTGDTGLSWGWANALTEMTVAGTQTGFGSLGASLVLSTTATYRGVWIDWDNVTRDANAPVLEGSRIELPASYTDFGTSFAAYFGGGGESLTLCDGTYSINTSGNVNVGGDISLTGTVDGIDIATDVAANSAKNTNVPTELSIGTTGVNTVAITSDGGADDVTLPAALVGSAGLLTTAKWAEIVANNAKVTMTYPGAGIALTDGSSWSASIANNSANWNTAFTDRLKWDGGATDLVAGTGRTSLGGTTIGQAIFIKTNPGAITFGRANADNSFDWLSAADFRTAIGGTTIGKAVFISTNPGAITFGRANADNSFDWLSDANFRTAIGVDVAGTDNSTDVTLHATATAGGMSLAAQEISNRAATNAQTGYMTAALVQNIETNNAKVTNTDDQKIDVFSGAGNTISISLEADGEANKTLDISGFTAIAANTAKDTDDDDGVDGIYGAGWDNDTDSPEKDDVYDKIELVVTDVDDNSTHRGSDGSDHADVVANTAKVVGTHPVATIYVPSSDQARADDSAITIANTIVRVVGDGAAVLLDTAPSISDGAADGQMVVIQGTSDANTVTIADNTNCQLAGGVNMTLGKGDTIQLIWDSGDSDWYELTRSDN